MTERESGWTGPWTITVLGLGEAGKLYAEGYLAEGADVRGYDLHVRTGSAYQVDSVAEALLRTDIVVSLVGAAAAVDVAREVIPLVLAETVFADFNTAAPREKRSIATLAADAGIDMVDIAVMAPVERAGHRTRLLASGTGAARVATLLGQLGTPVTLVGADAGDAASLKLLRSVFMKGLAALMIESIDGARAVGAEEWIRDEIAGELGDGGEALVERLVSGTYQHAARRHHEVAAALAQLETLGVHNDMTSATLAWLSRILDMDVEGAGVDPASG